MMKKLLIAAVLLFTTYGYAQKADSSRKTYAITSNNKAELEKFDLNSLVDFFKDNDPDEEIKVSFKLGEKENKNKNKTSTNHQFSWKGKTKELKSMLPIFKEEIDNL